MTTALAFQSTKFDVVDQNGQPWLQARQIGKALGYSRSDAILNIYERNKDEFSLDMTTTIEMMVGITPVEVRIFSLRGCHLLAMFARTDPAKAFRHWVLDVLESLSKHGEPVALPPTTTPITPDQQCTLQGMVKALVEKGGIYANIWSRFNNHFRLGSYKQLPQSRMSEAVAYLMQLDVSPKALPQYEQAPVPAQVFSGEFSKEELTAIYREVKALNKEWHDLYNFFNQRRRISRRLKELYSPVARVCMARITGVHPGEMYTYPVDWIAETLHSHEGDTDKAFSDAEDAMSLSFARTFNFLYALNEGAFDLLFTRRSNFIP